MTGRADNEHMRCRAMLSRNVDKPPYILGDDGFAKSILAIAK